jgi:hypothetical protein
VCRLGKKSRVLGLSPGFAAYQECELDKPVKNETLLLRQRETTAPTWLRRLQSVTAVGRAGI